MMEEGFNYPLHLGVTEAGAGEDGRIKSAVGIGTLLMDGIGDTIRISLTESTEKELAPAKKLVERFKASPQPPPKEGEFGYSLVPIPLAPICNRCEKSQQQRHCEPDRVKQSSEVPSLLERAEGEVSGLLRYARNDAHTDFHTTSCNRCVEYEARIINLRQQESPPVVVSKKPHPKADYVADDRQLLENTCIISGDSTQTIHGERKLLEHLLQQNNDKPKIFHRIYRGSDKETLQLQAATDFGALLIDGLCDGIYIETPDIPEPDFPVDLSFAILQAARSRFTNAELISCPSCGRTQFDIIGAVAEIREKTRHLKGITIAVMGCIVNGPGEMAGADYGYIGSGKGKVTLFKQNQPIIKNIPQEQAVEALMGLIKSSEL
jgi:(E)-4-hydroxy-3-methylbut-2-enyl-diphosphate synthase